MPTINQSVKNLIRNCPNTRLHVLFMLWGYDSPPTALDIALDIPADEHVVGRHLRGLESDGYVWHTGQRWHLTSKGVQIPLPGLNLNLPQANDDGKNGEKPHFLSSSSSSYILPDPDPDIYSTSSEEKLLLLPGKNGEKPHFSLPPAYRLLVLFFKDTIGPNSNVASWIAKAAESGDTPADIIKRIEGWADYMSSDKAGGIQNPAAFVGKQITAGQDVPDWFYSWDFKQPHPSKKPARWRNWIEENGFCRVCQSEPCTCKKQEGEESEA